MFFSLNGVSVSIFAAFAENYFLLVGIILPDLYEGYIHARVCNVLSVL